MKIAFVRMINLAIKMNTHSHTNFNKQITLAGSLIAIGIVFGDIGTSPLYTLNAVFHNRVITENVALGSLSCIFWTLCFQTTLKTSGKWIIFPAMAGGAFLIADGIITPPISVASAIEGLKEVVPTLNAVPIIVAILIGLFIFQQFGTEKIGKIFGPAMVIWFGFIGILGAMALSHNLSALKALNPYYAYQMLTNHSGGFWLLGSIFLCTTGAEALYSDMGHCGRNNIRISWSFIKITLILSYAGQTAWLLNHVGETIGNISPFYHTVPSSIYLPAVIIATIATIIASQALISGCFTLINEAIRLGIWPKHLVLFPGKMKGQLYIPAINWFLMVGCVGKELEELDVQAVISLRPEVVIVDELAHTNIEGSANAKRWQDVVEILDAGINVISAVNIQHIESLNEEIKTITNIEVKERIPDSVIAQADEVVNIDLTADELIARLKEGKIYQAEKIEAALKNFFQPSHILQLRELALKEVASQVERKVETEVTKTSALKQERFLACISSNEKTAKNVIRKTARLANYYHSKWYVLYVQTPDESADNIALDKQRHLINNFKLATELGAEIIKVENNKVAKAIIEQCEERSISTVCIGKPHFSLIKIILATNVFNELLKKLSSNNIDLIILS
ncbi:unnamed protein product [Rotaria sp. Silwood1]|nr:unnamed protein product [Rotaria sp. Silwood1]